MINVYQTMNAQMQKIPQPGRALVEAGIVVGVLAIVPFTRKYALWAAILIAIVWTLKALSKNSGSN